MIEFEGVHFQYRGGDFALSLPELRIPRAARIAVVGPSGSGKTTLLHLVAGIALPETGRICVDGQDVTALGDASRRAFRLARIGLVFQEFELLDYLDVLDNILLPFRLHPRLRVDSVARARSRHLAGRLGLSARLGHRPARLSQGERQRVAVCRALAIEPPLLLADEPTGNLDPANKQRVLDVLLELVDEIGSTLLTVTHDRELLPRFERVIDVKTLAAAGGAARD